MIHILFFQKHEREAASYLNVIKSMKTNLEQANEKKSQLESQLTESSETNTYLEQKLAQLSNQLAEQERENLQLVKEREDKEREIQIFSTQIEDRCKVYKKVLDEKQNEIDTLKERYETLIEQVPGIGVDSSVEVENKRLVDSSKEKDKLIKVYDEKFQVLSAEFMDSTQTIKKLIDEREILMMRLSQNRSDECCEETRAMLKRSNERNMELQEMLEKADEDNILKAKQAFEAIATLKSYEQGTDGLADALKKIHQLQETVHQRDKQIREFVLEVNAQNEVMAENSVLRRRLGISDDEIVETKAFLVKQKRYAKINDRLMLKLRASEELRLQSKIDKHELKRRISELERRLSGHGGGKGGSCEEEEDELNQSRTPSECSEAHKFKTTAKRESHRVEMKQCGNCSATFNVYDNLNYCRNCIATRNLCENCMTNLKMTSTENIELIKKVAKLEVDHQSITDENENLRAGLNEILEKLREYEGM
jgi:centrosomal protein CEP290